MPDPYRNFKFEVESDGFVRAGFSKITGLGETTEDIEYREGGENESPHHLSGQTKFNDVVFERGMSTDSDFINWRKLIYDLDKKDGAQGTDDDYRKTIVVFLKDKSGDRVKKWTISRAWPKEVKYPDLDASANEVAIESMTVCNEGIKMETL